MRSGRSPSPPCLPRGGSRAARAPGRALPPQLSATVIDSQSVKAAGTVARHSGGFGAGKLSWADAGYAGKLVT
jgi:hypothetical protein